ncbi:2'-5' RNA ligase family protein [Streptomyces sp. NPDC048473]|uniref:2'-5' RNA ligase family protein n=1 Tax=unclassified Streptomyces TaxID=2593676 RepID=UPI00371F2502
MADVHPDEPLNDLHRTVRAAIQAARGPHATGYPSKVPYLTIGYAADECDSDRVQRKLRNEVRPGHDPSTSTRCILSMSPWTLKLKRSHGTTWRGSPSARRSDPTKVL